MSDTDTKGSGSCVFLVGVCWKEGTTLGTLVLSRKLARNGVGNPIYLCLF